MILPLGFAEFASEMMNKGILTLLITTATHVRCILDGSILHV